MQCKQQEKEIAARKDIVLRSAFKHGYVRWTGNLALDFFLHKIFFYLFQFFSFYVNDTVI